MSKACRGVPLNLLNRVTSAATAYLRKARKARPLRRNELLNDTVTMACATILSDHPTPPWTSDLLSEHVKDAAKDSLKADYKGNRHRAQLYDDVVASSGQGEGGPEHDAAQATERIAALNAEQKAILDRLDKLCPGQGFSSEGLGIADAREFLIRKKVHKFARLAMRIDDRVKAIRQVNVRNRQRRVRGESSKTCRNAPLRSRIATLRDKLSMVLTPLILHRLKSDRKHITPRLDRLLKGRAKRYACAMADIAAEGFWIGRNSYHAYLAKQESNRPRQRK